MDDTVDELYSAIKFYLTQISREALSEREGRRWTDIVSFTINMEQIGDTVERVLQDVEDKKIRKAAASPKPAWPRSATCTSGCCPTCAWA
jgi:phosphate:Na+ symporter